MKETYDMLITDPQSLPEKWPEKYKTRRINELKVFYMGLLPDGKIFFKTGEYSSPVYAAKLQNNDFRPL